MSEWLSQLNDFMVGKGQEVTDSWGEGAPGVISILMEPIYSQVTSFTPSQQHGLGFFLFEAITKDNMGGANATGFLQGSQSYIKIIPAKVQKYGLNLFTVTLHFFSTSEKYIISYDATTT